MATYTFSDLDLNFNFHPVSGGLSLFYDDRAILRSIQNLLLTAQGEIGFEPTFGSSLRLMLFENRTPMVDAMIAEIIKETIANYEPRAILDSIEIQFDTVNNGYSITMNLTIKPFNTPVSGSFFIERPN